MYKVPWYIEAALEMLIEGALYAILATVAQTFLTIKGPLTNFLSGVLTAICVQLFESTINGKEIDIATLLSTALVAGLANMTLGSLIYNIGILFKKVCNKFSSGVEIIANSLGGNGTLMKVKLDTLAYSIDDVIVKVKEKLLINPNKFINNLDSVDANKISHIMLSKHSWEMVTDDVSWNSVKKIVDEVFKKGDVVVKPDFNEFSLLINGVIVEARFFLEDDIYKIGTEYVKTKW